MLLGYLGFAFLFPDFKWQYEAFHVLLESTGSVISFTVAFIIFNMISAKILTVNYFWLTLSFVTMGILDLAHSQTPPGQAFVWLHSSATFMGGLLASLIWLTKINLKIHLIKQLVFATIFFAIIFSAFSIALPELTFTMLDESGEFTRSAKLLNIVGGAGFIMAWLYFCLDLYHKMSKSSVYFSNNYMLFGLAGLLFEVSILWDGNWWLWHVLRAFAYLLLMLLFGIKYLKDIKDLYITKQELQSAEKLDAINKELENSNLALQKHEQQLEVIIDNLPVVFYTKSNTGKYLIINREYEQSSGILKEQIVGKTDNDVFPDDIAKLFNQSDKHVMESKETHIIEEKAPHPDGTMHDYESTKVPLINEQGSADILLGMSIDITEQKILEQGLRDANKSLIEAKERADLANKAKSEFLANMSHEIRTPMHGIISFSSMGVKRFDTTTDDKKKAFFEHIKNSADRLMILLNDLLDLSKLESGKMDMSFAKNNLSSIVDSCIAEQQARIESLNLSTAYDPQSIPGNAVMDGLRIGQVITNFLSNAIKYSPQDTQIEINISSTKLINDECERDGILLSLRDHGQGVATDELELIFDDFKQGSDTVIGTTKGTGLGLSISKHIIDLHQGNIWAENHPDGGAIFNFVIPVEQN